MPTDPAINVHATALVLGERGVMIMGPSGSGKTTLALTLLRQFDTASVFARLVGDDQLFVRARGGRLIASCPDPIAGLAEVSGLGPRALPHLDEAVIDIVVKLVEPADAPRFSESPSETIARITLPRLDLPKGRTTTAALALTAWLKALPFR